MASLPGQPEEAVEDATEPASQSGSFRPTLAPLEPREPHTSSAFGASALPGQPGEAVEDAAEPSSQSGSFRPTLAPLEPLEPLTSSVAPNAASGKNWQDQAPLPALATPLSPETRVANGRSDSGREERRTSGVAHMPATNGCRDNGPSGRESSFANGALAQHVAGASCGEMAAEEVAQKKGAPSNAPPDSGPGILTGVTGVERLGNGLTPGEDALRRYNLMLVRTSTPER